MGEEKEPQQQLEAMHVIGNTPENAVVADLATRAAEPRKVAEATLYVVPLGMQILETVRPAPRRMAGVVVLSDFDSLVAYVKDQANPAARIYADVITGRVTAVLNDHRGLTGPGWRDHRAVLQLRPTPEWQHWTSRDDKWQEQASFADHIEQGVEEIVRPVAAEMLEMAQHFEATTRVDFESARVLASGERKLLYKETMASKAGQSGDITIPREFELGIAPFEGSDRYKLIARFRYQIREGKLTLAYKLVRPDDVIRTAFNDIVKSVAAGTEIKPYAGVPEPL